MTEPVVIVHNRYRQRAGEDAVVDAERALLLERGHPVGLVEVDNDDIEGRPLRLAAGAVWSPRGYRAVRAAIRARGARIVHVHNTVPLLSPAVYYAAAAESAAVVQTLHNYRLTCVNGQLFRDGGPCVDCVGRSFAWPGIVHRCYRASTGASATVATSVGIHRLLGTWKKRVHRYVALTDFARRLFVDRVGLPGHRVVVKPNFLADPPPLGAHDGGFILFVGRLAPEKGVATLLEAWRHVRTPLPLVIVGEGPSASDVVAFAASRTDVRYLGARSRSETMELMRQASLLVFPSIWFEGFPMVLVEAMACGLPVVASGIGGIGEIVRDDETGWLFAPGDAMALSDLLSARSTEPSGLVRVGARARAEFDRHYDGDAAYDRLVAIYRDARLEAGLSGGA